MTLESIALWLLVIVSGLVVGAGLYETVVVMPFWAYDVPLAEGNPFRRVPMRAGANFWRHITPLLGLLAIIVFATGWSTAGPHFAWRTAGSLVQLFVVIWTLVYFRPTIVRMIVTGGADAPPDQLTATAARWVSLNYLRLALILAGFCSSVAALALRAS